jgi:hypothetical protein
MQDWVEIYNFGNLTKYKWNNKLIQFDGGVYMVSLRECYYAIDGNPQV